MIEQPVQSFSGVSVEAVLREELAHGDAVVGTIAPILRHLLANDDHSLFSDEIIARLRGMMDDLARQLLDALAAAGENPDHREHPAALRDALAAGFVGHPGFLSHVHALALEWQLTERLHARLGVDPVLSPLLQALIASQDGATATHAMALLASQARFAQNQRRLQLPLSELPGDMFHAALLVLADYCNALDESGIAAGSAAVIALRGRYDEARSRLGLIARIVAAMGGGASAALSLSHAGVAIFATALGFASGQDREMAILSTNEGQLARFALSLRAGGLKMAQIEEQFLTLHPDISLPDGFEHIGSDRAAALLAGSARQAGY